MAARLIVGLKKRDYITPALQGLHWLPIEQRIQFKVLLITFKALHGMAPEYIKDMIVIHHSKRQLRSSKQTLLVLPKTRMKSAGDKTFACQAAILWNNLPESIRTTKTVESFKHHLKTHIFKATYNV